MAKVIDTGSDIQLLFGVLGGGELSGESGALIKRQLTELQKALNADPFKIKVALDTEAGGKRSWSSMLQTKLNALGDGEKFSIKISKLDIGDGAIGDFKRRIEAVLNTLSLEKGVSLSVKSEDVGEVASKVRAAGDAAAEAARKTAEFNTQMETLGQQKGEVSKALNAIGNADLTEEETARVRELRTQYEAYATSINEVKAAKRAATPERKAEIEAEGRAILETVQAIQQESKARAENADQKKREADATAAESAAKDAIQRATEFRVQIEALNRQKSEVLKALNAAEKADLTEEEGARVRELRTQYEGYAKSIYEVDAAKKAATPEHRAEIEAEGRAILETVNALNEERRARDEATKELERKAAQSAANAKIETNEANLYKQIADAIIRVQAAQKNWTAAQYGSANVDYARLDEYIQRLQDLRATLDTMTPEKAKATLADINREFKNSSEAIRAAGENTKTFTERLGGLASKFGIWLSASRIVMTAVRLTKQLVRASAELDDAMTQLQIVTRASNEELEAYSKTAAETARKIGSSISDLVDSTTTYARLGYTMERSGALAQYTAMLQNVGNIDVADAQDAITSIVKAFGIGVDEIESVMDKLVITGKVIARRRSNASKEIGYIG